ncbi:MAG: RNase H family protein [Bdellovibrionota bacterium]
MKHSATENKIIIFTDGASSGNPGPGGWAAIMARPDGTIEEIGGAAVSTTNNRMELQAAIQALNAVTNSARVSKIEIYTDSSYLIKGITKWCFNWQANGWITSEGEAVVNQDLWLQLLKFVGNAAPLEGLVSWKYVAGHSGVPGNERADEIAVGFSKMEKLDLYKGPVSSYPFNLCVDLCRKNTNKITYLSFIDGIPMRHKSWSQCERRVKGISGAKFKKAANKVQELQILREWGVQIEKLIDEP